MGRMVLAIPLFIVIEVVESEICAQVNDTTMRQGLVNQRRAFAVRQAKEGAIVVLPLQLAYGGERRQLGGTQ